MNRFRLQSMTRWLCFSGRQRLFSAVVAASLAAQTAKAQQYSGAETLPPPVQGGSVPLPSNPWSANQTPATTYPSVTPYPGTPNGSANTSPATGTVSPYPSSPYQASPYQASPYGGAAAAPLPPPSGTGAQAYPSVSPYTPGQAAAVPFDPGLAPLGDDWKIDTSPSDLNAPLYQPYIRDVPVDVFVNEGQTGRFVLGGSVNTDLGVAGQIIVEERNFDITALPGRNNGLFSGAFRGAGQNFRLEALPGNRVQRYAVDFTEPNLFGYSPFSFSVSGFFFNRVYQDWDEERLGGSLRLGYVLRPDLSLSSELRLENVDINRPRVVGVPALDAVVGDNDVYTNRWRLVHNTRDHPFLPTEGHLLELIYDQVFGEFDFPRGMVNYSRYFLLRQRPDFTGRHTLTTAYRLGFTGSDTPVFENFFAGGVSTLRGFEFRGASPVESGVIVGGRFQFLGSVEYMFPLTADDMVRGVAFVDYGTVERDIDINSENFRVAPGLGFRVAVPALGPAPLAFDFAVPINRADGDQTQTFSFNAGFTR